MYAGRLDRKITLRSVTETSDSMGQPVETFADLATVPAAVKEQSGKEIFASGAQQAQKRVAFTIRHRDDVTEQMQVVYGADTYDIEVINEIQRRRGLELICVRRTG